MRQLTKICIALSGLTDLSPQALHRNLFFFFFQMLELLFFPFHVNNQTPLNSIFVFCAPWFSVLHAHTSICISVKVEMLVPALSERVCVEGVSLSTHSAQCYLKSVALKHSIIGRKLNVLYLPQPTLGSVYIGRHHQLYHVCSSTFNLQLWCLWHV